MFSEHESNFNGGNVIPSLPLIPCRLFWQPEAFSHRIEIHPPLFPFVVGSPEWQTSRLATVTVLNADTELLCICTLMCSPFFYYYYLRVFVMWTIFKVFIKFVTKLILFSDWFFFFGCVACGVLGPRPGIKPGPLALEGTVLTTSAREVPAVVVVMLVES